MTIRCRIFRLWECFVHRSSDTSQELAELRIQYPDGLLYESVSAYAGENEILEKELDPDKGEI